MFPEVWKRVVKGSYQSAEATIHGFRRVRVRNETYPVLIIAKGAPPVLGRIYYDVSPADLKRLDEFEADAYVRVPVAATTNGTVAAADAYLGKHDAELLDEDWSPTHFAKFDMAGFLATYAAAHSPND